MPAPFTFALNTSTIRCGDITIEKKIEVAAEAGYTGIEPWVDELDVHCEQDPLTVAKTGLEKMKALIP